MSRMSDHGLVQALDSVDHSLALGILDSFRGEHGAAEWIQRLAPSALGIRSEQLLTSPDPELWAELARWIRDSD